MSISRRVPILNDKNIGDGITAAGQTATTYITAIDESGIKVHASNNPNSNYSKINADGLEVFTDNMSAAKFGVVTRIGQEDNSRVEIDSDSIALIADTGLPALSSETSSVPIDGVDTLYTLNDTLSSGQTTELDYDLSSIASEKSIYVNIDFINDFTVTYYNGSLDDTKSLKRHLKNGGICLILSKKASGTSSQSANIDIVSHIDLSSPKMPSVDYTYATKSIQATYTASTGKITIAVPTYTVQLPNRTSQYTAKGNTYTIGITDATTTLVLRSILYDKTVYIPKTSIYGRFYLELNHFGSPPDQDDYYIVQHLRNLGWDTDCLITE